MRVMVTGALGKLGRAVCQGFAGHTVHPFSRQALNLANEEALATALTAVQPEVVINCAAWTDVDGAETHPEAAWAVNTHGVAKLAEMTAHMGVTLVHFSSDYVFNGEKETAYTEEDQPLPVNLYGAFKVRGDEAALRHPRCYVLRLAATFAPWGTCSVGRLMDTLLAGEEVEVWSRAVSPSYAPDVAMAVRTLLERDAKFGLYNCVSGVTTWAALARRLAELLVLPEPTVHLAAPGGIARRPRYHTVLSGQKLAAAGVAMPPWTDALRRFVTARLSGAGAVVAGVPYHSARRPSMG